MGWDDFGIFFGGEGGDGSRLIPVLSPKYLGVGALWPFLDFFLKKEYLAQTESFSFTFVEFWRKRLGIPHPTPRV